MASNRDDISSITEENLLKVAEKEEFRAKRLLRQVEPS